MKRIRRLPGQPYSLRAGIAILFGLSMILLAVAMSIMTGTLARRSISDRVTAEMASRARGLADTLHRSMYERIREIENSAFYLETRITDSPDNQQALIETLQNTYRNYLWIGIADPDGFVSISTDEQLNGNHVASFRWFAESLEAPFVGRVRSATPLEAEMPGHDESLRLVDIAVPIMGEDDQAEGVLIAHLDWAFSQEIYEGLMLTDGSESAVDVYIVNQDGETLLASMGAPQAIPPDALEKAMAHEAVSGVIEWEDGESYLTGVAQTPGFGGRTDNSWIVIAREPVDIAFAGARELETAILWLGTSIGLMSAVVGWLLARRIAAPIGKIAQAARTVSYKDPDASLPQFDTYQEIASLSASLRAMIDNLQLESGERLRAEEELRALNVELEERVEARTAELQAANERLQELDVLKSNLISEVSHELRNPLSAMFTQVYLLERQPERSDQHLDVLTSQMKRLRQLVEDILDVSRLESGGSRVDHTLFNLNDVVGQAIDAYGPRAGIKGLTVTFDPDPSCPPVLGVQNQIGQVVSNLLVNAINYTEAGSIHLWTYCEDDDQVCFAIRDTGIGIPPDAMDRIWDRFYRGDRPRSENIPGTGLGLSIVKEIVQIHGGEIEVISEVGDGTEFRVHFPRGDALPRPDAVPQAIPESGD